MITMVMSRFVVTVRMISESRNNTPVQDLAIRHVVRNLMTWVDPRQPSGPGDRTPGIAADQAAGQDISARENQDPSVNNL
jgi:hypothetical protein